MYNILHNNSGRCQYHELANSVIERHGRPVAQLVPVRKRRGSALGAMRGQFTMEDGWERALTDEEAEAFWGGR
jgi:antitoxin (DNA-binding transcriptional repressor) of toxin-antitoxin stability system